MECLLCPKCFPQASGGNTSNLTKHVTVHHPREYHDMVMEGRRGQGEPASSSRSSTMSRQCQWSYCRSSSGESPSVAESTTSSSATTSRIDVGDDDVTHGPSQGSASSTATGTGTATGPTSSPRSVTSGTVRSRGRNQSVAVMFASASKYDTKSTYHQKLTRSVVNFICKAALPVYTVEKEGFKSLLEAFYPR